MIPQRIRNMKPSSRSQLQKDLENWGRAVERYTEEELLKAIRDTEGESLGLTTRVYRLRSWFKTFGRASPVAADGYTPPDLVEAGAATAEVGSTEFDEFVVDYGDKPPEDVDDGGADANSSGPSAERHQDTEDHLQVNIRAQALVMNLNDFLRVADVDLNEWRVVDWEGSTWTTSMKLKREVGRDKEGRPIMASEPQVVRNWRVKVRFQRRFDREFRLPRISVVRTKSAPAPRRDGRLVALVIPDPQIGYRRKQGWLYPLHDPRILSLAYQMAEILQPDIILGQGDTFDFAELSQKYPCPVEMIDTAEPALATGRYHFARLRAAAPRALHVEHMGNHEKRLGDLKDASLKGIARIKMPGEAREVLSVAQLLEVDKLGIEYVEPYTKSYWLWGQVESTHGDVVRGDSGATVASLIKTRAHSLTFGHIHRAESAFKTYHGPRGPRQLFVSSFGCACRIAPGVVPGVKQKQNWQNGLGIIELDEETRQERSTYLMIHRGRLIYQGRALVGQDLTAEIGAAIGWPLGTNWMHENE